MTPSEILRRIANIARFRTITQTKSADGKALARVKISEDAASDFLPVMNFSNSFKRHWIPVRVNEQVLVICPFGEADSGFIIRGIFNKGRKEHALSNDHTEVIDYEDGTVITYDTEAKELKIAAVGTINITAANINIAGPVNINGDLTTTGSISDSIGSLTGHVHTGVTPGSSNTGIRP